MPRTKKQPETVDIAITVPSEGKVRCMAIRLDCAPHFALHPCYLGHGSWDDNLLRISHIASGMGAGNSFRNKKRAITANRCIAAVLERMPVDWNSPSIGYDQLKKHIPAEIQQWCKDLNREYA